MREKAAVWSRWPRRVKEALGAESLNIIADAGYSNGEQAGRCKAVVMISSYP
jgi:hypothetical protein